MIDIDKKVAAVERAVNALFKAAVLEYGPDAYLSVGESGNISVIDGNGKKQQCCLTHLSNDPM